MNHIARYSLGFIGSVLLTLTAYLLVTHSYVSGMTLTVAIVILALIQFFLQMVFFLHLGEETRPRWRIRMFIAMSGVLLIVVFGSVWIMNNLNYHMMSPEQSDSQLMKESNKGF